MAKVIRLGVEIELSLEEEKAFETVLKVFDNVRFEDDVDEWVQKVTPSGCGIDDLYNDLDALYQACV